MSRDGAITLPFADRDYVFRLAWGELEKLQEATDTGPWVVLERLANRQCRVGDVAHVVRLGLIGGGLDPVKALTLTRQYVEQRPPDENVDLARTILSAAVYGALDEIVGEPFAASETAADAA